MGKPLEFASLFAVGLVGSSLLTLLPLAYAPLLRSVIVAFGLATLTAAGMLAYAYCQEKRGLFAVVCAVAVAVLIGLIGGVVWLMN